MKTINYEAWAKTLLSFVNSKDLDRELTDFCGGWRCPIVPERHVVVPVEPTEEMIIEVMKDLAPKCTSILAAAMHLSISRAYKLMIAAAPDAED